MAGRFALPAGEQRSELYLPPDPAGADRWYAFSIYIPEGWVNDPYRDIVAQWHEIPDWHLGETWRVPPLSLALIGGQWQIASRWDSRPVNVGGWSPPAPYGGVKEYYMPLEDGAWTDWVFHVDWSWQSDGRMEVWKNGTQVVDRVGPNTFNDQSGNYLKVGVYHPDYQLDTKPVTPLKVVYHDEVRVGGSDATLSDMTPGAPPPPPPPPRASLQVNFQPAASATVPGYVVDSGKIYGLQQGRTFGWTSSQTDAVFERNINADQLLDTHVAVKAASRWELAVPSGKYLVKLSVGDAAEASRNNIWVEGNWLIKSQPLIANVFLKKSITVAVSDGRLTVGIGSAPGGQTRINYVTVDPVTTPVFVPVKFNFQPSAAPPVSGYLVDAGQLYGARGGQIYGWTLSHTDAVYDRNINPDQRLDTHVAVKATARWELAVPNGRYTVAVSMGDAGRASRNNVWVEGVNLANYHVLPGNTFLRRSITVDVSDGKLTVGIGGAATGTTRINYVEVNAA